MTVRKPAHIVVVGAGPAGLAAAEAAGCRGERVTVLDRMPSAGRKFLMAGRGGLNLTHGEPLEAFLARYGAARTSMEPFILAFDPARLRAWADALGAETFEGTSGRIFPRAMKASPLLRAWLRRLEELGVVLRLRTEVEGLAPGGVLLRGGERLAADAVILACGGASWTRLGSDGRWTGWIGADCAPLAPANCGFVAAWPDGFGQRWAGSPIKGAAYVFGERRIRGEATITTSGVEGGAIYALSAALRDAIGRRGAATLMIDLKPDVSEPRLAGKLASGKPGLSTANRLRRAGVQPAAAALARALGALPRDPAALAHHLKNLRLRLTATTGMERAISSAGGLRWTALDDRLMLRDRPGVFAAGEMLDWEAPTGGYLLHGCIATGRAAGTAAAAWLSERACAG
ncbi:MAG: TIGR03862 family flavoprotein [Rubrimonas sp.]